MSVCIISVLDNVHFKIFEFLITVDQGLKCRAI